MPPRRPSPRVLLVGLIVSGLLVPAVSVAQDAPGEAPQVIERLPAEPVAAIEVEGNRRVAREAVLRAIRTRPGEYLEWRVIQEDVRRLFDTGFFDDVAFHLRETAEGPVVVVRVVEKPAVRQVRYAGNEEMKEDDLQEIVEIAPYALLDQRQIEKAARDIEASYREKGFYLAEVTVRTEPVPGEAAVDVVFDIVEQAKVQVRRIRFIGNENIPDAELKANMETREGHWLSFITQWGTYRPDAFEIDLMRIAALYYDRGYINVQVGQPQVTLTPDRRFIHVTIPVEEGEEFRVGTVAVSGDLLTDPETLRAMVPMEEGAVFVRSQLGEGIFAVQEFYQDQGYAYANVNPLTAVDPEARTIDLDFEIHQGEQVTVERIEVRGNTRTRDKVIRREMRIHEGEIYSGSRIVTSRRRVQALGYFEEVDVATRRGSTPDRVVLEFTVKERPTGTFQVGAGLSSGEGPIATVQVSHDNLFGRGQSFGIQGMFSRLRTIYMAQFTEPYFLDTNWTLGLSAFNTEQDYLSFLRRSTGGNLTFGYQLVDDLRLLFTYTGEQVNVAGRGDIGQRVAAGMFGGGFTSSAKLTLNWDTRDDRMFPTRGFYHTASVEHAPEWLLSENLFTRYSLVNRWYWPLPLGLVGRLNLELGYITGEPYPMSERYFLGGVYSLRGYFLRSISPTERFPSAGDPASGTEPFPIGGNKQIIVNLEAEFPLLRPMGLRGVVFYDVGNTYAEGTRFFLDPDYDLPLGMFHSVGFGVRWFSPIGPLRFEWGIPLTRRPGIDEPIRFEFTVGNFF
jgi:outer membrane protein insertion porin family